MNNLARNEYVLNTAPEIWFDEFMPAINAFAASTADDNAEMYSADKYYDLLKVSAEMNYQSGWLINTGSWICDHTWMQKASFDLATGTYNVSNDITSYDITFDGSFDYCRDWLISRAAWLSSQMYSDYTPVFPPTTFEPTTVPETTAPSDDLLIGDADGNGQIDVKDVTYIQKHLVKYTDSNGQPLIDENDSRQFKIADVNGDNQLDVNDVTQLQKIIVKLA